MALHLQLLVTDVSSIFTLRYKFFFRFHIRLVGPIFVFVISFLDHSPGCVVGNKILALQKLNVIEKQVGGTLKDYKKTACGFILFASLLFTLFYISTLPFHFTFSIASWGTMFLQIVQYIMMCWD